MEKSYKPVSCDFHDELTSRASLGRRAEIVYRDENDDEVAVIDYIEDVYTKDEAEYTRLKDGTVIRLDRVVRVDDETEGPAAD